MDIVIAYDISETNTPKGAARLRRLADICSAFGQRVQESMFECRLSPTRYARFLNEIRDSIDPAIDSVLVYRFPGTIHEHRTSIGTDHTHRLGDPWIL